MRFRSAVRFLDYEILFSTRARSAASVHFCGFNPFQILSDRLSAVSVFFLLIPIFLLIISLNSRSDTFIGKDFEQKAVRDTPVQNMYAVDAFGDRVHAACVFGKQSLGPFHCDLIPQAPLIPKLRGQLAEFLDNPSPVGLRILSSSTCVGLRYGRLTNTLSFSRLSASYASLLVFGPFRPGQPSPGSYYQPASLRLTVSAATES